MSKPVAVLGMTLTIDPTTVVPPPPAPPPTAVLVVNPPTATKVLAASALVHRDGDRIIVTNVAVPGAGATTVDPGPFEVAMEATVEKVPAEGEQVLVVGDQSETISATPSIPGPPVVPYPVTFKYVITDPGQTVFEAQ